MTPEGAIRAGVRELGVALPAGATERLAAYLALLERWNRVYNLTAVRTRAEMVPLHLLDSLAILPWACGARVLDVGSGAGLPGIPLALARPEARFFLLDSSAKRVRFLAQAVIELPLPNCQVVHARVDRYRSDERFDTVVSRAFASPARLLAEAGHLCAAGGRVLAMAGRRPARAELDGLPPGFRVEAVRRISVPGLAAERHLIRFAPAG